MSFSPSWTRRTWCAREAAAFVVSFRRPWRRLTPAPPFLFSSIQETRLAESGLNLLGTHIVCRSGSALNISALDKVRLAQGGLSGSAAAVPQLFFASHAPLTRLGVMLDCAVHCAAGKRHAFCRRQRRAAAARDTPPDAILGGAHRGTTAVEPHAQRAGWLLLSPLTPSPCLPPQTATSPHVVVEMLDIDNAHIVQMIGKVRRRAAKPASTFTWAATRGARLSSSSTHTYPPPPSHHRIASKLSCRTMSSAGS